MPDTGGALTPSGSSAGSTARVVRAAWTARYCTVLIGTDRVVSVLHGVFGLAPGDFDRL
ncbi:hypothetical protein [Streptomyces sp. NPDC005953]|uniref:hypothetical protein n=1 Tax=Streptomyces sp. NPDC005953 TaxID=3156719 RepID=UPI00340552D3